MTGHEVPCKDLLKKSIHALDGDIGSLYDIYFDDRTWNVRYLVVDTGKWLPGRKVLLSPFSLIGGSASDSTLSFDLSKEQIQSSPNFHSDLPVSRQQESELRVYYGWPSVPFGGLIAAGMEAPVYTGVPYPHEHAADIEPGEHDPHLQSVREVMGYHIEATDGEIGHIEDFGFDLNTVHLVSAFIDTSNWPGGRLVRLPIDVIKEIRWADSRVLARVSRVEIENGPSASP